MSGELRFGVIPAAMPAVPALSRRYCDEHPGVTIRIYSRSSVEIEDGIAAGTLEAGLTYLDNEPIEKVRAHRLYRERYVLLTPQDGPFGMQPSVTWRDAARLPLCLLVPTMQNRRIVDALFRAGGAEKPKPAVEADSFLALMGHVVSNGLSSVVPDTIATMLGGGPPRGIMAIPLVKPNASHLIGIVVSEREPLSPLARSLLKCARMVGFGRNGPQRPTPAGVVIGGSDDDRRLPI